MYFELVYMEQLVHFQFVSYCNYRSEFKYKLAGGSVGSLDTCNE